VEATAAAGFAADADAGGVDTLAATGSGFLTAVDGFALAAAGLAALGLTMPTIAWVIDLTVLIAFLAMTAGLDFAAGCVLATGLTALPAGLAADFGGSFGLGLAELLLTAFFAGATVLGLAAALEADFTTAFAAGLAVDFAVDFAAAFAAGLPTGFAAGFAAGLVAFAAVTFDLAVAADLAGAFTAFDFAATIALPFV